MLTMFTVITMIIMFPLFIMFTMFTVIIMFPLFIMFTTIPCKAQAPWEGHHVDGQLPKVSVELAREPETSILRFKSRCTC